MTHNSFADNQTDCPIYYSEKLRLGLAQIAFVLAMTGSLGIAYGHAYGAPFGFLIGGIASFSALLLAFLWAPKVEVTRSYFQVGKAKLELKFVGDAKLLDSDLTKRSVRQPTNPPGYQLVRPWIAESIVIIVSDTTDPHPFWQVSSRNPTALLAALNSAKLATEGTDGKS